MEGDWKLLGVGRWERKECLKWDNLRYNEEEIDWREVLEVGLIGVIEEEEKIEMIEVFR